MKHDTSNNGGNTATLRRPTWNNPVPKDQLHRVEERAHELDLRARAFIRDNPVAVVCGAVAIGFLVGRLLVRR